MGRYVMIYTGQNIKKLLGTIYRKNKEILLYLFLGGITTTISIVSYAICNIAFGINELIANIISWILAVLFAFFTNRRWVFETTVNTVNELVRQMLYFFGGRLATLLVEEVILFIFITLLGLNSMLIKVIAQVVVIVVNYIISKFWVFKK